jgi:NAD(P)-dependent dehydrogenase (short-subunit alcohol dehydrogenase family)
MSPVWLITGSSRGLGRALGEAVLAAGHRLVATARNPERLSDLVGRFGERVRAIALDVTDAGAAVHAVRTALDHFGQLDVLVNNAGYGDVGSIEDTRLADIRAQIETNLFGVINVTKAAIPVMREQGSVASFRSHRSAAAAARRDWPPIRRPSGESKGSPKCSPRKSVPWESK